MRLLPAVAIAVGLLAGHVRGQYRNRLGIMDGPAPHPWPRAVAEPPILAKRDGYCDSGFHPCSDVNSTSCCSNTQYCIIAANWEAQCCAIGLTCGDPCDAEHYYANETVTTTITASANLAAITTTTVSDICAGRSCSGSQYGCPSSLGGHCCGFGLDCATNTAGSGICIGFGSGTSSSITTATSTSSALPTSAVVEHKSQGLSTGAKAGIAIAVIVVAALVIGALTYLCIRRRRTSARSETTTAQELPSMMPAGRGTAVAVAAASAPQMSEADGDTISYGYAPSSTGLSRAGGGPSQGDYFGEIGSGASGALPPPQQQQDQSTYPHGPDSVVPPVEIGTRASLRRRPPGAPARIDSQGSGADGSQSELADTSSRGPSPAFGSNGGPASPVESIAGRFELYGDFVTPASGHEVFHEAQETVGGNRSRAVGGTGTLLPQPFPTPGSEISEFATPSPMSREEEAHPRRDV